MRVTDLNREQLVELKQDYMQRNEQSVSWGELADADTLIPDHEIFNYYNGVYFTKDDFNN